MFKRGQIEDAIIAVLGGTLGLQRPQMQTRIKRLLDTDRARGRKRRSAKPEEANYAFYCASMPGRGYDVLFSGFEAFALLMGLRLLALGFPQGLVVGLLRRVRVDLERRHRAILRQDPGTLFDVRRISAEAKPGDIGVGNIDPVFLVVVAEEDRSGSPSVEICQGQGGLSQLIHRFGPGQAFTLLEIVNVAHALSAALKGTKPRGRGRASA